MSWQKVIGLPHRARTEGAWHPVRPPRDDEDGGWTWEHDGAAIAIDIPDDFARAVAPGVEVTIDYTHFELVVWRGADGRIGYRAAAAGVTGPDRHDEELALWALLERLGRRGAARLLPLPLVGRRGSVRGPPGPLRLPRPPRAGMRIFCRESSSVRPRSTQRRSPRRFFRRESRAIKLRKAIKTTSAPAPTTRPPP